MKAIFDAVPDALVGVDGDGVIRVVNADAEALFGYESDELVGLPLETLVPDDVKIVHESHRRRYTNFPRRRAMGAGLRLEGRRKDGTAFPADIALSMVNSDDGPLFIAAVRDASEQWAWAERERLQTQLHQSQRLESIGQLADGVAHDFNNLLAIILNYAAFSIEALSEPPPSTPLAAAEREGQLRNDIEQIKQAAERAARLTNQLLVFSRGGVRHTETVDVNATVSDLEHLLRRTLATDVRLTTRLQPGLWPIEADRGQIEQVLLNLVVNARDAMPDGGALDINTENTDTDEPTPRPMVRITVSDTGVGMSPEVAKKAFDPFFTTKPRGEGVGLGLATVYGVVSQAGGTIELMSEPALGTTFTISLPASINADSAEAAPVAEHVSGHGQTILVAEDEPGVREVVRRVLTNAGYRVIVTASGEEALAVIEDESVAVDLVLTDMVMPGMSGPVWRRKALARRPRLRALYMSGYTSQKENTNEGVPLLPKPFTAAALLAAVEELLRNVD